MAPPILWAIPLWVRWTSLVYKLNGFLGGLGRLVKGLLLIPKHPHSGMDGTVSGWEEAKINSSSPLRYDRQIGKFTVVRAGLYYLYCQVSSAWLRGQSGGQGEKDLAWEVGRRARCRWERETLGLMRDEMPGCLRKLEVRVRQAEAWIVHVLFLPRCTLMRGRLSI